MRALVAPRHLHGDELARALAVAGDLLGEVDQEVVERLPKGCQAPVVGSVIAGAPSAAAAPVANRSSVSEVEVSPSTVTQLKLLSAPA